MKREVGADERRRETVLYAPVKRFLTSLGLEVKGEIRGCDVVAVRAGEPPLLVIGELKLAFNLELLLQGIDRMGACDEVWLAVRLPGRRRRAPEPTRRNLRRPLLF